MNKILTANMAILTAMHMAAGCMTVIRQDGIVWTAYYLVATVILATGTYIVRKELK